MKKEVTLLFSVILGLSCRNAGDKNQGSLFIDRDYDFVLGFLVPDEDRKANTEIFVGKLLDKEPKILGVAGVEDTFLHGQLMRYQNWYRADFDFHADAKVRIKSAEQEIYIPHVSHGTYIDTANALRVRPLQQYWIEVQLATGVILRDSVIIPGDYELLNLADGDTVPCYPKKDIPSQDVCVQFYPVIHSTSAASFLYRHRFSTDIPGVDPFFTYLSFRADQAVPALFGECDGREFDNFQWEILALDSSATIFFTAEDLTSANEEVWNFLDSYSHGSIEKRNGLNTGGFAGAIGNIGACNAVRFDITMRALRDSCVCDGPGAR